MISREGHLIKVGTYVEWGYFKFKVSILVFIFISGVENIFDYFLTHLY